MNCLAIIPARAGSKGIPNKNIRIVRGRPLVYYSINNAIESTLITDIIVSTDSPEVGVIAKQMGVKVRWRDESLCADNVTLDAVIADAIPPDTEYDYIITLQPTSPTLKVQTLDEAIRYTIENRLDTVISVFNSPHLSWILKDGKTIPNYTERLNRQFLPPYYQETGAFLISKSSVVTKKSRIGKNVDVFEVSESEALDIDTFEDLRHASELLSRPKVGIYVKGNNEIGTGHIYRALEIADEFYVSPDILYDTKETDPYLFGRTTHNLVPIDGVKELYKLCNDKQYSIFINDILDTSLSYMSGLKASMPSAHIINFEDGGEGGRIADLVFNALYSVESFPQMKSGEKYYICGKTFLYYEPITIRDEVKRVFICFGGADPQDYTDRLLNIISKPEYREYEFAVALGRAKHNIKELLKFNQYENIDVFYDVANMPELMASCDIGVTSRGRTGYELAILGIPSIAIAENRREEKHGFVCNENGFAYLGIDPEDEIIELNLQGYLKMKKSTRQKLQNMLINHDLRNGRNRVMSLIRSLKNGM